MSGNTAGASPAGNLAKILIPLAVWAALLAIPVPSGLPVVGWYYFAMFMAVIVGLISGAHPWLHHRFAGHFCRVSSCNLVGDKPSATVNWALSGFSNSTIWLIFIAYMFGLGYEKTGLGRRVALNLVKKFWANAR
jgi:L-tartrate/succinate antiporter